LNGRIPFVDAELFCASERYGEVSFHSCPATDPTVTARLVGHLMIREIDWQLFENDLLEEAARISFGAFMASGDRVLLEFDPYKQLIKDVIGVVPPDQNLQGRFGRGNRQHHERAVGRAIHVTAVENTLGMLDRLRLKHLSGKLTVVKSSVENLSTLGDQSFDAAVMVNVLTRSTIPRLPPGRVLHPEARWRARVVHHAPESRLIVF
jgi:hypothetical protein